MIIVEPPLVQKQQCDGHMVDTIYNANKGTTHQRQCSLVSEKEAAQASRTSLVNQHMRGVHIKSSAKNYTEEIAMSGHEVSDTQHRSQLPESSLSFAPAETANVVVARPAAAESGKPADSFAVKVQNQLQIGQHQPEPKQPKRVEVPLSHSTSAERIENRMQDSNMSFKPDVQIMHKVYSRRTSDSAESPPDMWNQSAYMNPV